MAEWSMAVVLKTTVGETPPGVFKTTAIDHSAIPPHRYFIRKFGTSG